MKKLLRIIALALTMLIAFSLIGCDGDSIFPSIGGDGGWGNITPPSKKVFNIEYRHFQNDNAQGFKGSIVEGDRIGDDAFYWKEIGPYGFYSVETYTFEGWYDNKEFIGEKIAPDFVPTSNMTLYAKYSSSVFFEEDDVVYCEINEGTEYSVWKANHVNDDSVWTDEPFILPSIVNGKEVTSIDSLAGFEGKIAVPDSVSHINPVALSPYSNHYLIFTDKNKHFSFEEEAFSYLLYNKDKTKLIRRLGYFDDNSFSIPQGVTSIGKFAFYGAGLENVTIPSSVTEIEFYAFLETALITVQMPDSVKSIGDAAFANCPWLQSIVIPDGVKEIGDHAFTNCHSLANVEIPKSVVNIGTGAFHGCDDSLTSLTLPKNVINIGESAFENCRSLTEINIPEGVTEIKDRTFANNYCLTNLKLPQGLKKIGESAFELCNNLATVLIPEGVTDASEAYNGYTIFLCEAEEENAPYEYFDEYGAKLGKTLTIDEEGGFYYLIFEGKPGELSAHVVGRIGGRTEYTVKPQIEIGKKMYEVTYAKRGLRNYAHYGFNDDDENFIRFSVKIPRSVSYWEDSVDANIQIID